MIAEYLGHFGDDLMVVNCARVSFAKWTTELRVQDAKLIRYLAEHKHISPFFHPVAQFRITVPFFVAAQLKRHQVGFAINEVSRRYVDSAPTFYEPSEWRSRPDGSIKQGSGAALDPANQRIASAMYSRIVDVASTTYSSLLRIGVAPEQARAVLPLAADTSWIWTGSLYAWARMCSERLAPSAQGETRVIAQQVSDTMAGLFPVSWPALVNMPTEGGSSNVGSNTDLAGAA